MMITKRDFLQGKSAQAEAEYNKVIQSIEQALQKGSTSVSTYDSFKAPDDVIVERVAVYVQKYGWSLKHSKYHGDQRDPGDTHTWTLV